MDGILIQHRHAKIRIDKSSLNSNLHSQLHIVQVQASLESTHFLSSEGYADGYQLNISLKTPNDDGRIDACFTSDMIDGTLPAVEPMLEDRSAQG